MMKLVKKAMALLLVGAMACGTLVGCGNSEKETTKAAEGNTTEAAETAAQKGDPKKRQKLPVILRSLLCIRMLPRVRSLPVHMKI